MLPPKNRILSPESVNHASVAIATYAMSAARRRFIPNPGAQGWIRTTERRKGGQIYSLLALTAHPPVHDERTRRARDGREPTCYQRTVARLLRRNGGGKTTACEHTSAHSGTATIRRSSVECVLVKSRALFLGSSS